MFYLAEIRKHSEGVVIDQVSDIKAALLERSPEILDVSPVVVKGQISHEAGLYLLTYEMTYTITLPSSRSLEPVALENSQAVNEVFIEQKDVATKTELVEEDLVLILEDEQIDLVDSLVDNILLNLPSRVLTAQEEADDDLPSGTNWSVLTESQYEAQKQADKEANSPFAGLSGLFDQD